MRAALSLLAHSIADELPAGGQVTVRTYEGEYELDVWVTCRLPRLRFWRRRTVRRRCVEEAVRAVTLLVPVHVVTRVRWGVCGS